MKRSQLELTVVHTKRTRSDASSDFMPISSFQHLPNEVFLQIVGFLDLYEITNAFLGISQRFDSLLLCLTHLSLTIARDSQSFNKERISQYAASITRLVIDKAQNFVFASMAFTNIRSLVVKYGTQKQYDSIRPCHFPLLQYLHITDGKHSYSLKSEFLSKFIVTHECLSI